MKEEILSLPQPVMVHREQSENKLKTESAVHIFGWNRSEDILKEYQERVASEFSDIPALNVLSFDNQVIKGSNSYAITLAYEILAKNGYTIPSFKELSNRWVHDENKSFLCDNYLDAGFLMKKEENSQGVKRPNATARYIKKNLLKQLGKKISPMIISLGDLHVKRDEKSPSGLSFIITEQFSPTSAASLAESGSFYAKNVGSSGLPDAIDNWYANKGLDHNGISKYESIGDRYILTSAHPLSRIILYRDLMLASVQDFEGSGSSGRIAIVKTHVKN